MDSNITQARALLNEFGGHALVLAVGFVTAFAANHGLHLNIPALPAAITATGALAVARAAAARIAKAWHSGRLEAVILADLKRDALGLAKDAEQAL